MSEEFGAVLDVPEVDTPVEEQPVEASDIEVPEEETPETPEETPETDEGEAEEEAAPETPAATDGRKLPDDIKKGLAALKTDNPVVAGKLKTAWFEAQEYRTVFTKPADAVAAKDFLDQIGGKDGFQELQAEREQWSALDRSYAEEPEKFVKELAENSAEAFTAAAPHVINQFAQRAPEQYGYYANKVALNTLSTLGVSPETLSRIYAGFQGNEQAQGFVAELHNALIGLQQKATQFEQKRLDPREEQLKQREQQFEERRRADFETGVATQAQTFLSEKMQPEIDRVLSGRKVDEEAAQTHRELVQKEVEKRLAEIPGFKERLESFYRSGDAQKSLDYIRAQYNRVLPDAVKKVIAPLYRNIPAAPAAKTLTAKAPGAKPATPGQVVLKDMPGHNEVDWSQTSVADLIEGRAVLTNGKRASGWA